jgi:hypothetical protein
MPDSFSVSRLLTGLPGSGTISRALDALSATLGSFELLVRSGEDWLAFRDRLLGPTGERGRVAMQLRRSAWAVTSNPFHFFALWPTRGNPGPRGWWRGFRARPSKLAKKYGSPQSGRLLVENRGRGGGGGGFDARHAKRGHQIALSQEAWRSCRCPIRLSPHVELVLIFVGDAEP